MPSIHTTHRMLNGKWFIIESKNSQSIDLKLKEFNECLSQIAAQHRPLDWRWTNRVWFWITVDRRHYGKYSDKIFDNRNEFDDPVLCLIILIFIHKQIVAKFLCFLCRKTAWPRWECHHRIKMSDITLYLLQWNNSLDFYK